MALHTIHLFAGAGGGLLADLLLGHTPICAVELEQFPRAVLLQRQLDGCLPRFPIWDDVCTFRQDNPDTSDFFSRARSIADDLCICGGFPCQDISAAGDGAGITGERSGLWKEYARIIREIRPRYAFIENSPLLTIRGLDTVLCDLAEMGYDAEWCVVGAGDVGAIHKRERIWVLACDSNKNRLQRRLQKARSEVPRGYASQSTVGALYTQSEKRVPESAILGKSNGVAHRVDRTCAVGNGQCPQSASLAFNILMDRINDR